MAVNERSVTVLAVNNGNASGFNVYLDFSGQKEYLMWHRHNGFIFNILRHGRKLSDLRRLSGRERREMRYLLTVIDEYLEEEKSA